MIKYLAPFIIGTFIGVSASIWASMQSKHDTVAFSQTVHPHSCVESSQDSLLERAAPHIHPTASDAYTSIVLQVIQLVSHTVGAK